MFNCYHVLIFFRTPIELIKCKMQVQMLVAPPPSTSPIPAVQFTGTVPANTHPMARLPGPIEVLKTVVRTTGLRGLWLGQTGTLIRETGGSAAWFGSKEFTAGLLLSYRSKKHPELLVDNDGRQLTKKDLLLWESAASGASAGVLYNLVLFPADTVKSTIQTEGELRPRAKGAPRPTFFGTLNQLYIKQGLKGLYAGCGITIARAVPSSGLIFLIYDGLCKRFP
jgi:mitochondrial ornithine carrier protein